jgi:hypothetical protein
LPPNWGKCSAGTLSTATAPGNPHVKRSAPNAALISGLALRDESHPNFPVAPAEAGVQGGQVRR